MFNFDIPRYEKVVKDAIALRPQIEEAVDKICEEGYSNLFFIGCGGTYAHSLPMKYWLDTRSDIENYSVIAAEVFHGTLDLVEKGTSMILLYGEDETRPIMDRVRRFSMNITDVIHTFDTKSVELPFTDPQLRKIVSPMVMYAITERLSCHLEKERNHPLTTRRYYRQMEY